MSVIPRVLISKINRKAISAVLLTRNSSSDNRFIKCSYPDVEIPQVHLTEFVLGRMAKWHNKVAIECGITGRKYTYDEIQIKSKNLSRAFRHKLKLQRGDVVALLLPNIPEFPICVLGVLLAGLTLTTINPTYTSDEIKRQLLDADAKTLITLSESWGNAKSAITQMAKDLPILVIKKEASESLPQGALNFQEFIDAQINIPDVDLSNLDDIVFMPYSSGTTGVPKGVQLSSRNLVSNLCQSNSPEFRITVDATDSHQDITPAVLPFFHVYGFTSVLFSFLLAGGKMVTLPRFTKYTYLNTLIQHKPHLIMIVPPMVIFLNTHPEVKFEHLQSLRTVMCGAAPLGALDEGKLREKINKPINVLQGYGLSEGSPVVTIVPADRQGKYPGTMGHPLPNTILKVVGVDDPDAKHLEPHQTGELLIKGPQVMRGYHNKPEETQKSFLDGWLRSGDLVYYDKDNMFYVADRIKELIKVKGFQVAPAELEEIIRDFPGVADAAVIGIPHEYSGEVPRAYVIPNENTKLDTKKLKEFVEAKVARHKRLVGGVAIVDSIPKTASGKILRRELKLQYEEKGI